MPPEVREALLASPDVGAITLYGETPTNVGSTPVDVVGMEPLRGALAPQMLSGRLPVAADEIALGSLVAEDLHVGAGDAVDVAGAAGTASMRVTGIALVPPVQGADKLGRQGLVSLAGFHALDPSAQTAAVAIDVAPDAPPGAAERIAAAAGTSGAGIGDPPPAVRNVDRVRAVPLLVAAAVALLVVLSLGHLVVVTVRRRRRDVAILRALGAQPRWLRHVVHWQASLTAGALLVVAVPVGLAGGRSLYRAFAEGVGARADVTVPFAWVAAALAALVVLANVAAALPARRAARLTPARVLRGD